MGQHHLVVAVAVADQRPTCRVISKAVVVAVVSVCSVKVVQALVALEIQAAAGVLAVVPVLQQLVIQAVLVVNLVVVREVHNLPLRARAQPVPLVVAE